MTPIGATWLLEGARRLRTARRRAVIVLAISAALLAAVGLLRLGAGLPTALAAGLATGLLVGLGTGLRPRHGPLTAAVLASHLNRTLPAVEESAQLLLGDPAGLPILSGMQRRRVESALAVLPTPPPLPRGPQRGFLRAASVMTLLAGVLAVLPSGGRGSTKRPNLLRATDPALATPTPPPGFGAMRMTVRPPAHTGRPTRRQSGWDADVEEGATIEWSLTAEGEAASGRLITTSGDTVRLGRQANGDFSARLVVLRSTLYRILLEVADGRIASSPDQRITVQPDTPPILTIVQPASRSAVRPGDRMTIPVDVLARDDFGVDSVSIVATVTRGQGEGVKFREQRLAFASRDRREAGGLLLRQTLDLAGMGLEPGDELYFHILATDRRVPVPNQSRSETVFVTMVDTSRAESGPGAGVALQLPPDFFRSQRQLIIDTERLLSDQRGLARADFRDRSNGLGIDQGLLRLRYGQFMGDEYEGVLAGSGREAHADRPGDDPPPPVRIDPITGAVLPDPLADLRHEHDDPENATLLAPQIKAKLREAISQMWAAELQLRLAEPRRSLPFQHRALELLQEIRQDARSYVKRVGFDPPPLEPDRARLSGDLSKIRVPVIDRSMAETLSAPVLRRGLESLQRLRAGAPAAPAEVERLEAAGQELARLAVDDANHLLEPLRSLRLLIASLRGDGPRCEDCLATSERGFWRALPVVHPGAAGRTRSGTGLVARYYQYLERRP